MHLLPYTLLFIRSMIAGHQLVKRPSASEDLPLECPVIAWGADLDKCLHSAFSFIQYCHEQEDVDCVKTQIPFFPSSLATHLFQETEAFPSTIKATAALLRENGCFLSGLYPWAEANSDASTLRYICSALDFTNTSQTAEIRDLAKRYSTEKVSGDIETTARALQDLSTAMNDKMKFLFWQSALPDEINKAAECDLLDKVHSEPTALDDALKDIREKRHACIKQVTAPLKPTPEPSTKHPATPKAKTLGDVSEGMTLDLF